MRIWANLGDVSLRLGENIFSGLAALFIVVCITLIYVNRYILLPTVFVDSLLASRGSIASPETTSQARQSKSKSRAVSDCGIGLDGRLWHTYLYKTIRPPIVGKL